MQFRLGIGTQFDRSRDLREVGAELVRMTELAREGDFDAVVVPEHHATDDAYLLNEAVVAHLAEHVGEMVLGTGMCLLPFHNPVRIAEFGATVDVLTGGRFRLGVAQGYRDEEFDIFGIDKRDAVGRFTEGVEIIERLWTEEHVSHEGVHFTLDDVGINPRPLQRPRPDIIVGASNEASIRRAARIADGWSAGHVPFQGVKTRVEAFRDARRQAGLDEGFIEIGREVFVADTSEAAEATVRGPLMRKYAGYMDWGQDEVFEDDEFDTAWDRLKRDRFIVGSPDDVIEGFGRYADALEPDCIGIRTQFPGIDPEDVHESVRLLGDEVIPAF